MFKNYKALIFSLLFVFMGSAQEGAEFFTATDTFLKTYVDGGKVDYRAIVKDPSSMNKVLGMAEKITVSKENPKEYQAFWINGYNLLVIKSVVDNYPIESPLDKAGFFDKKKHKIGGRELTLNDIEHEMLRAVFPEEPRFHFVLVCAGLGCPPIINRAYAPASLEVQLEEQTKLALNDPLFIQVKKNKVGISQIFEWYKNDFTQDGKGLVEYINQYRSNKLPEKAKVSFYEYNWALNEK
ncbi:DUF547 domain-containing protein [Maribacter sp. TH_r10]|uniref:DUF547 domain-containing protein n=1 Tax=Maribacter sp. TH_r10 TaxID=3082086 RepID=UPI0029543BDC|nr:DUF547 domain-containing protein [Maribacter sp. TH_r10]MDV7138100.1 DUF547 domain-containing protein [Maribacter sp. TH_r10]